MRFNTHYDSVGKHAFLSASKHHWVNYSEEKLDRAFLAAAAAQRGTELHDFAKMAISLGVKLPDTPKTMNLYVNDAIGFKMIPEQVLYYSSNAFGTADTISFRKNLLRIHDLKTGISPCNMRQLKVYMAFFCLEYRFKPQDIEAELRIYQNDAVEILNPDPAEIAVIMDRIVSFDSRINVLREEVDL